MKKYYVSIIMITLGSGLIAQPTLTIANSAPQPGDEYISHGTDYHLPGNAGPNQVWDLSNMVSLGPETTYFVDPLSTPDGVNYPTADVAAGAAPSFQYWDYDNGGMDVVAVVTPSNTMNFTNPMRFLGLPLSYGSSWTDSFMGSDANFTRTGTNTGTADSYGTLMLPWGTVTDVLRVHYESDYQDDGLGFLITYEEDAYYFYKPGIKGPLAYVYDVTITTFGIPQTIQLGIYMDQSAVSVGEQDLLFNNISIFPIPADETIFINTELRSSDNISLAVIDMTGRTIIEQDLGPLAQGVNSDQLDVSQLPSGTYFLRFIGTNTSQTETIIVR